LLSDFPIIFQWWNLMGFQRPPEQRNVFIFQQPLFLEVLIVLFVWTPEFQRSSSSSSRFHSFQDFSLKNELQEALFPFAKKHRKLFFSLSFFLYLSKKTFKRAKNNHFCLSSSFSFQACSFSSLSPHTSQKMDPKFDKMTEIRLLMFHGGIVVRLFFSLWFLPTIISLLLSLFLSFTGLSGAL